MKHIRHLKNKARSLQEYLEDKKKAEKILGHLESKTSLSTSDIKKCDEYAQDVFHSKKYAHWLKVYTAIAGEFKEGWIPDNYYGQMVVPRIKGAYGHISSLKPLNRLAFHSSKFPDIGCYINGLFLDSDYKVINETELKPFLFQNNEKVVYKIDDSRQGLGVFIFDKNNFDAAKIRHLGNGLFQSFITQHDKLSLFTSNAVATLRVTTAIDDTGAGSLRSVYLRLGGVKDDIVKSATNIRIPIDLKTGQLSETGYTAQWLPTDRHPASGEKFAGHVVPEYEACVQTVLSLHQKIPFIKVIGWDVAVDSNNNVQIMEWNGVHNDIKFSEATQGPCFKDLNWEQFVKDK